MDHENPAVPVLATLVANGLAVCEVLADLWREDLYTAGLGYGFHAFALRLFPDEVPRTPFALELLVDGQLVDGPTKRVGVTLDGKAEVAPKKLSVSDLLDRCCGPADERPPDEYLQELYEHWGGAKFVSRAYAYALRREPDPTGFEDYLVRLEKGQLSAAQLLERLLASDEASKIPRLSRPTLWDSRYPFRWDE